MGGDSGRLRPAGFLWCTSFQPAICRPPSWKKWERFNHTPKESAMTGINTSFPPLSETEIELIQAYRAMEAGHHFQLLAMVKELAAQNPDKTGVAAINLKKSRTIKAEVLDDLRKFGFESEEKQIDLNVFVEAILDKIDHFDNLNLHNMGVVNSICCFAGYASQKVMEVTEIHQKMLEIIGYNLQGDRHA
ncbi:hypothetical protein ACO0K0_12090 [Undibacterium sp. SXout11W]|uniref:hypothetical protein n=1 Tax=Undibacterium sp. SXout11W TaxID=3413050 RepID=UPI003BF21176